ncbi:hypothetical protein [Hyphobacterium marinum]|uniref:Uncharacterized protein n=1 Tax=Hyphobacterium marinum TaxID=3116574 RepID=A0ABU7LY02_9PROT|nr:hypothetical protein [Hyphobacterium sp. Y6023]MEE2566438.1 hypothetical protein [Hyphobacterium sp. Y6023]
MILRVNDTFFYLLTALVVAAMIAPQLIIASSRWESLSDDVRDNGVLIEGNRLAGMAAGSGLSFEMVRDSRGRLVARITADRELGDPTNIASAGVFDALQAHELEAMAGFVLRVTFTINSTDLNGAATTHVGGFQLGIGQSGWSEHTLTADAQEIEVMVYPPNCDPGYAFFGVWPSALAGANSVDLHSIRVEAVEPYACSQE